MIESLRIESCSWIPCGPKYEKEVEKIVMVFQISLWNLTDRWVKHVQAMKRPGSHVVGQNFHCSPADGLVVLAVIDAQN